VGEKYGDMKGLLHVPTTDSTYTAGTMGPAGTAGPAGGASAGGGLCLDAALQLPQV
jgi:hypothetical protein